MRREIDDIIMTGQDVDIQKSEKESPEDARKRKYEETQRQLAMQFKSGPAEGPASGFMVRDDDPVQRRSGMDHQRATNMGRYNRVELDRSDRLNVDPIMELKHVIGYQSDKCTQVRWSRTERESVVIFSTGGALVAMDTEQTGPHGE